MEPNRSTLFTSANGLDMIVSGTVSATGAGGFMNVSGCLLGGKASWNVG